MKTETYEVISLDEQNGEILNELVSEEALALIETLGLEGQQSRGGSSQCVQHLP